MWFSLGKDYWQRIWFWVFDGEVMDQANMNKKLFPIYVAFQKVALIFEICGRGFVHIVCAPCQQESKKQKQYAIKEFLLVHSFHPFHGQVGWMPRLAAAGAGREADLIIIPSFPGSPTLCLPVR